MNSPLYAHSSHPNCTKSYRTDSNPVSGFSHPSYTKRHYMNSPHYEYFAQSDEYSYLFKVYDQEGNYVRSIIENTSNWISLSNIEGHEEQMAFLRMTDAGKIGSFWVKSCRLVHSSCPSFLSSTVGLPLNRKVKTWPRLACSKASR